MNSRKIYFSFLIMTLGISSSCFFDVPEKGAPDHIRVIYTSDPATSLVIGWNKFTGKNNEDKIFIDTVDHGIDAESYTSKLSPHKYTGHKDIQSAFVKLENLKPDTRYFFLIKNTFGMSKRFYVDTLPNTKEARISFIAGGDSRNNRTPRVAANILVKKLKPHFVLFGGDMTSRGTDGQWWGWFDDWQMTIGDDGRVTPIIPARGNHEDYNEILARLFWVSDTNYYAVPIAGDLMRVYTLNSEATISGNQTNWLKSDLSENKNVIWKMAQYHKPMRPHVKRKSEGSVLYKIGLTYFTNIE